MFKDVYEWLKGLDWAAGPRELVPCTTSNNVEMLHHDYGDKKHNNYQHYLGFVKVGWTDQKH